MCTDATTEITKEQVQSAMDDMHKQTLSELRKIVRKVLYIMIHDIIIENNEMALMVGAYGDNLTQLLAKIIKEEAVKVEQLADLNLWKEEIENDGTNRNTDSGRSTEPDIGSGNASGYTGGNHC